MARTRASYEILDANGNLVQNVLITGDHTPLQQWLWSVGGDLAHPIPNPSLPPGPPFSRKDPVNSIIAGLDALQWRDRLAFNVFKLCVDHNGVFLPKRVILREGGSEGTRRWRQVREQGWPMKDENLAGSGPWWYKIDLDPIHLFFARQIINGNGPTT